MIKLGVIFGGKSTENEISVKSATSILKILNKEKYEIYKIYIDKNGEWYEYEENKKIENIIETLKSLDVVFPVLHGLYGEDGTIQGLFEMAGVKYVGCKVLASSVGMDKVYAKTIFEKAKINQAKYVYIKKYKNKEKYTNVEENFEEKDIDINEVIEIVKQKINYPVFVKPSNSGSSVGVNRADNDEELKTSITEAAKFDTKILIEEGIIGKEVECAVLGNSKSGVIATLPGEILSAEEFYTFDAKYINTASKTLIPADISKDKQEEVKSLAIRAFNAIDGNGLSRVDFFVENDTEKVYINEINTMPGFTDISMYPKLFEAYGIEYSELLDRIIEVEL